MSGAQQHLGAAPASAASAATTRGGAVTAQALAEAGVPARQIHQRLGHLLVGSRQAVDKCPCSEPVLTSLLVTVQDWYPDCELLRRTDLQRLPPAILQTVGQEW